MALLKTRCPECNAPLKSPTGFTVGQTICCPKCETYFTVESPEETDESEEPKKGKALATKKPVKASVEDEDDSDDEAPRKKKKKKKEYDEDETETRSYKSSPLRFVVLGVLLLVMLVLGYFLYEKWKGEREVADANNSSGPSGGGPGAAGPLPLAPAERPGRGGAAKGNNVPNVPPGAKQLGAGPKGGPANPFGGLIPPGTPAPPDAALMQKLKTALVGTWSAELGDGATQELTYNKDGTFTTKLNGPEPANASGKYTVKQLVGTKGLKIQLDAGVGVQLVTVTFEDDELQHPSLRPGVTGTFRKK